MNDSTNQFLRTGLGDARLRCLRWADDDLQAELDLPAAAGGSRRVRLTFRREHEVRVQMDFGLYAGAALLWELLATARAEGGYLVEFNFGGTPAGHIRLICEDLESAEV